MSGYSRLPMDNGQGLDYEDQGYDDQGYDGEEELAPTYRRSPRTQATATGSRWRTSPSATVTGYTPGFYEQAEEGAIVEGPDFLAAEGEEEEEEEDWEQPRDHAVGSFNPTPYGEQTYGEQTYGEMFGVPAQTGAWSTDMPYAQPSRRMSSTRLSTFGGGGMQSPAASASDMNWSGSSAYHGDKYAYHGPSAYKRSGYNYAHHGGSKSGMNYHGDYDYAYNGDPKADMNYHGDYDYAYHGGSKAHKHTGYDYAKQAAAAADPYRGAKAYDWGQGGNWGQGGMAYKGSKGYNWNQSGAAAGGGGWDSTRTRRSSGQTNYAAKKYPKYNGYANARGSASKRTHSYNGSW